MKTIIISTVFLFFSGIGICQNLSYDSTVVDRLIKKMPDASYNQITAICEELNVFSRFSYVKNYSITLQKYLSPYYRINSNCAELLSLLQLPKDLKDSMIAYKGLSSIARARLGDSNSIKYFIDKYQDEKIKSNKSIDIGWLDYYQKKILSLKDTTAINIVLKDLGLSLIIEKIEDDGIEEKTIKYTLPFLVIRNLGMLHQNVLLFDKKKLCEFFDASDTTDINPNIFDFYLSIERFVYSSYQIKTKIVVPFLVLGWPIRGYYDNYSQPSESF